MRDAGWTEVIRVVHLCPIAAPVAMSLLNINSNDQTESITQWSR